MKLKIACMDRRFNHQLDSMNDGETIFLRNAGANVKGLEGSIVDICKKHDIERVDVLCHNEACRGMGIVDQALKGEIKVSPEIKENLVDLFSGTKYRDTSDLERANVAVQDRELSRILGKINRGRIKHSVILMDFGKITMPEANPNEFQVCVIRPSQKKYSSVVSDKISSTFVLQAESLDEVMSDAMLSLQELGIKKYALVATNHEEARPLSTDAKRLRAHLNAEGKEATVEFDRAYA